MNILDQRNEHLAQTHHAPILYVAQAPYSSTLHITRKGQDAAAPELEDEGLFFLSRKIITRCLQEKPGLHIYPVFRDQYHAMKLRRDLGADTLYIQDLADLVQVVDDRSQAQQMAVFLNLFSGHENTTSQDLQALRAKTFQTGHTLMSREMNLLTLLLSDAGQSS